MTENHQLLEQIVSPSNLSQALRQVKRNKGCGGVDRLSIEATVLKLRESDNGAQFRQSLIDGSYIPQPVLGVEIPKGNGGVRQLGIPTVQDRIVQQAIANILNEIYELKFSESSYGFRPRRSAHQALTAASGYIESGKEYVVDIDLEKYFDTVNHDRLMHRLAEDIKDKRVLKLIGQYLRCGLMRNGIVEDRQRGTPQGGPLSPLLSNIVLDELDKELERRGHKFCRYADDVQIYVGSEQTAIRVKASITDFLESKLKLKVNRAKSAASEVKERSYLGHKFQQSGSIGISQASIKKMKKRVRAITKRNRGRNELVIIKELNQFLRGWQYYFKLGVKKGQMSNLDSWIRRRLRCYRLKQRKRKYSIAMWLKSLGVTERNAWRLALSDKGWWKLSRTPQLNQALPNQRFKEMGLYSLLEGYKKLTV